MVKLKNKNTGAIKECTTGYSWTTFFFGIFVPLFRGDLKWALLLLLISFFVALITAGFGCLVVGPVFAYFYNEIYIKSMIEKGYSYMDEDSKEYLVSHGMIDYKDVVETIAPIEKETNKEAEQ